MSLKHALETAREILAQASEEQLDETYSEAEEMKKRKGTKAGGEDTDVEVTADGEGAKAADGTTPKIAEPLDAAKLGKAPADSLKDRDEEEYGEGEAWKAKCMVTRMKSMAWKVKCMAMRMKSMAWKVKCMAMKKRKGSRNSRK